MFGAVSAACAVAPSVGWLQITAAGRMRIAE